jgi:FdhD protein
VPPTVWRPRSEIVLGVGSLALMTRGRTVRMLVRRFGGDGPERGPDDLIVEEPMEIRLDDHVVTTTMRTPGHDFELAVGFCFSDGLLAGAPITGVRYCATAPAVDSDFNVVTVETAGVAPVPAARLSTTTSSCGLCGTADLAAVGNRLKPLTDLTPIALGVLAGVPDRVRAAQGLFDATGGVHAAAAVTPLGEPLVVREDIGRHNAVDKVIGRLLLDGELPAGGLGLFVSGRASFEIVVKAWAAGFSAVVAVSAPSALAVETARAAGLTLVGFAREGRLNVYAPA